MDRIVLITGASKGIGKELAYVFAKNGYSLLLIARNLSELEQLQKELKDKYQCESKILSVDLAKTDSVDVIINTFKNEISKLDVLVNNAGFGFVNKFADMPIADINGMIDVNVKVLTDLTYRVLPFMLARKSGKILNVASTAAFMPGPYMAVYYATKAYVFSFSQAIREEYRKDGITISTLCPGPTKTPFIKRAGLDDTYLFKGNFPVMTAQKVASIAFKGLMKKKRVIIPGIMNKASVISILFMPTLWVTKLTGMLEKPKSLNAK